MFRRAVVLILSIKIVTSDIIGEVQDNFDRDKTHNSRIFIEDYPFLVSIQNNPRNNDASDHRCTGTILNDSWILTAAHCVASFNENMTKIDTILPKSLKVLAGSSYSYVLDFHAQLRCVDRIIPHEEYRGFPFVCDIALLKLKSPLQYTDTIAPIKLATKNLLAGVPIASFFKPPCEILGWARTEGHRKVTRSLQHTLVDLIPRNTCLDSMAENYHYEMFDGDKITCTFYKKFYWSDCVTDFGEPLVCGGVLVGVELGGNVCDEGKIPAIWTRIDKFENWIENVTMSKVGSKCLGFIDVVIISAVLLNFLNNK